MFTIHNDTKLVVTHRHKAAAAHMAVLRDIRHEGIELLMELLATEYWYLEKVWLETHKEGDNA